MGRGVKESYCFLISENGTPESDARLKDFCGLKDGFSVSELDLICAARATLWDFVSTAAALCR